MWFSFCFLFIELLSVVLDVWVLRGQSGESHDGGFMSSIVYAGHSLSLMCDSNFAE